MKIVKFIKYYVIYKSLTKVFQSIINHRQESFVNKCFSMEKIINFGLLVTTVFMLTSLTDSSQITKLVPVEEWIAFKHNTRNVKPIDKFIGKLRATYDFVFHKNDNISNIEKLLANETIKNNNDESYKLANKNLQNNNIINNENVNDKILDKLLDESSTRESSIKKLSKGNWLDDIDIKPLDKLVIVSDKMDDIEKSDNVEDHLNLQLPAVVVKSFINWLEHALGFSQGLYLKITNSTLSNNKNNNTTIFSN
ncbi:dual specificity mitogen-activated protein kinase kinase 1-like, partial [Aphidius gifuensis]|uniref:dual specificity mitogen-activated protein kinase kinase 1-like n=1 Tax=Aphidius gifuensis TaxID=684658 RepID=UPI001CDBB3B3